MNTINILHCTKDARNRIAGQEGTLIFGTVPSHAIVIVADRERPA
jgi:hypothetical protein